MFIGPRGGALTDRRLRHGSAEGFTEQETASPLAGLPYDLRHAAVSTWFAAGAPPAQVAALGGAQRRRPEFGYSYPRNPSTVGNRRHLGPGPLADA